MLVKELVVSRRMYGLKYVDDELMVYTHLRPRSYRSVTSWKVGHIGDDGRVRWAQQCSTPSRKAAEKVGRYLGCIGGDRYNLNTNYSPRYVTGRRLRVDEKLHTCGRLFAVGVRETGTLNRWVIEYFGDNSVLPVELYGYQKGTIKLRIDLKLPKTFNLEPTDSYLFCNQAWTPEPDCNRGGICYLAPSHELYRLNYAYGFWRMIRYDMLADKINYTAFDIKETSCSDRVWSFAVSNDGKLAAVSKKFGGVELYYVGENTLTLFASYDIPASDLVFNPDGTTLSMLGCYTGDNPTWRVYTIDL